MSDIHWRIFGRLTAGLAALALVGVSPGVGGAGTTTRVKSGLSATSLHLEITESIAMSNAAATAAQLRALKHIGVRIAVDDFGTGYSSLAYLRRFPVDVLKIDRAFISRLGRDAEDSDVVRFLIALARSLGLRTIAEGVELKEQLEVLRNLGCDEVQGFLTGRPMTGRDAEGWLTNNPHVQGSVTASIPRPRRDSDHGGRRALG